MRTLKHIGVLLIILALPGCCLFGIGNCETCETTPTAPSCAPPSSDTTSPSVSITSPSNGATVNGTTTITATASDNVAVTRVEFLVDGAIVSTDTSSPYSASWNTATVTNARRVLMARAYDAAGNQGRSSDVNVTVINGTPPSLPARSELPIPGVFQETAVWCWASVSEMVLRFYGHGNVNRAGDYQCGIVGAAGRMSLLHPTCEFACGQPQCIVPIGNGARLVQFLQQYPALASQFTGFSGRPFTVQRRLGPLTFDEVRRSIVDGDPIIAGITPGGIPLSFDPAHVALIIGYDTTAFNGRGVIVNDPYPYGLGALGPFGDPYLQRGALSLSRGRYVINYDVFVQALLWSESITVAG